MGNTLERLSVPATGINGVLASPAGQARGCVLVLGGSEGGAHERDALAFTDLGFTALALAYFGAPGVPAVLKDIPIEYFIEAIDFLRARGGRARIGIVGGSRGAEAALLVAAHDARVAVVVSVVGSGVITPGIDFRLGGLAQILTGQTGAWTLGGQALPSLRQHVPASMRTAINSGAPVRLADSFAALPMDERELEAISIPVERVDGPILLISAADDGVWPSTRYSEVAADRLRRFDHRYPWEHVILDGAGHTIAGPPGVPFADSTAPGPGVTFEMGGQPTVTTAARATAWRRTVAFLNDHLS